MTRPTATLGVAALAILGLLALPVAAQTPSVSPAPVATTEATAEPDPAAAVLVVSGVEYAFIGLPDVVSVGTVLGFDNPGLEFHEMAIGRIADDSDATLEELVEMGATAFNDGTLEPVGEQPLVANPGETAEGTIELLVPGRYLATCLVPQGMVPDILAQLGVTPDMAPADWPPEAQSILENPDHASLGMAQVFTVEP
jgi:hypothetical protein